MVKKGRSFAFLVGKKQLPPCGQVCQGRQVGGRAGWRVGWSAGWLVWLAGKRSEFGWLAGWLVWLAGWLKVEEFGFDFSLFILVFHRFFIIVSLVFHKFSCFSHCF